MNENELYQNPLPVSLECENDRESITVPTAARLSEVLELLGTHYGDWVICSFREGPKAQFIQTFRHPSGVYSVETREGMDTEIEEVEMAPGDGVTEFFLEWIRSRTPEEERAAIPAAAPPDVPLDKPVLEHAEQVAADGVNGGFLSFPRVVRDVVESLGRDRPIPPAQARRLVQPIWEARAAEQERWTGTSDNDRLSAAFAALDEAGITARQNFTCCRSCGLSEIGGEREGARGFVFYHSQDTEAAAAGAGLYLAYGGFDGSEETTAAVGREV
ncbi:DUF6891 domain-containing protein, partial [Nocardiopsis potens]|uniref:DUF6891 domain-containing protein n=1 Tax=Nocardiopsis potens TaxID=1246458 RepID=UPI00037AC6E3